MDWKLDFLTPYTHHSDLHVNTALPVISTHCCSSQYPVIRFLSTASNTGDSSTSRAHVHLSEPPVQNCLKSQLTAATCRISTTNCASLLTAYSISARTTQETQYPLLHSNNTRPYHAYPLPQEHIYRWRVYWPLPSNGCYSQSHHPATSLYATLLKWISREIG
jgi:hypothetical protein